MTMSQPMSPLFNVFTYGSLQIPEVMEAVTGGSFPAEPARLIDHACYRLTGLPYPGLIREPGAATPGVLYRRIGPKALRQLDAFEDDFYRRETVAVVTESGLSVPAEVYVIPAEHHALLVRKPWDLERFRAESLAGFLLARCRTR